MSHDVKSCMGVSCHARWWRKKIQDNHVSVHKIALSYFYAVSDAVLRMTIKQPAPLFVIAHCFDVVGQLVEGLFPATAGT